MKVLRCVLVLLALGLGPIDLLPTDALARQTMSFSPGGHVRTRARAHAVRNGHVRRGHARSVRPTRARPQRPARAARPTSGDDEGDAVKAVPGKGFTLENGILTYPAPARFQPKNLRAR